MFELVRRIAEMAAAEDLIRCARPHASAVVAALAAAPSTQDALLVEAATLEQGLDRLLFLVLLNEAVTLTDDPALEHLLAFWTVSITRSPADPAAAFATWRDEHAGMLAHEQPPAGASAATLRELQRVRVAHRLELLRLADVFLREGVKIVRQTTSRLAALMADVAGRLAENDRAHPESRRAVAAAAPSAVAASEAADRSARELAAGFSARTEALRHYLVGRALSEAEALLVTNPDDEALFGRAVVELVETGRVADAWSRVQRYRGAVLRIHGRLARSHDEVDAALQTWLATRPHPDPGVDPFVNRRALTGAALPEDEPDAILRALRRDPGACLVDFVCTRDETLVFASTGDDARLVARAALTEAELRAVATRLVEGQSTLRPGAFDRPWSTDDTAAEQLLAGLADLLSWIPRTLPEGTILCLVPWGPLHMLPLSALRLSDGRRLVERHPSCWLPAGAMLALCARHAEASVGSLAAGSGPDLPALMAHVDRVRDDLGPGEALGNPSVHELARALRGKRLRRLYLYGHGVFDPVDPEACGLAFPGGLLRAQDLRSAGVTAELVILASCLAGRHQLQRGQEFRGWSSLLLAAGFAQVLTAQWRVPAHLTRSFMERFCRSLSQGVPAVVALARTQRAMIAGEGGPQASQVGFWGAFQLAGNWS